MRKTGQTATSVRTAGAGRRKPIDKHTGTGNGANGGNKAGTAKHAKKTGISAYAWNHAEPASAHPPERKADVRAATAASKDRSGAADAALPEAIGRTADEAARAHAGFGGDPERALVAPAARIPSARMKNGTAPVTSLKEEKLAFASSREEALAVASPKEETLATASRIEEADISSPDEETSAAAAADGAVSAGTAFSNGNSARWPATEGGTAVAPDDAAVSEKNERCIVCGAADREGIRILARLICESCESEIVNTDVGDARYPYFIQQLRSLWNGEPGV